MPRVGLFIPCYIDQFYPDVGLATLEVLEQHGCEVDYPAAQTCCGQPMANTGCTDAAVPLAERMINVFAPYDYVVAPSGSCVAMVREHYTDLLPLTNKLQEFQAKTFELCEFLTDVLKVDSISGSFPYKVGVHQSCHGLRELRLARSSETVGDDFDKARQLLKSLDGISFAELTRTDECCGFGGTFAVHEEAVSCMMGRDRLADHRAAGTEVLTAGDMSCLMHLNGLNQRHAQPFPVMHIAQILAGRQPEGITPVNSTDGSVA
ncbi:Lactate utilization protein A [Polystyrenella longa]|uniref:Lactate utilization protein A n=1 Tax=Polystyrenella longa TaxID=2528007 RepID=A0A518CI45_9PLAN|nr:(Fe-S)-binding protein [Polystyrenella longa]QDU78887.1 Lactate utilization protein A [Polystyrenella longa]